MEFDIDAKDAIRFLMDRGWTEGAIANEVGCDRVTISRTLNERTKPRRTTKKLLAGIVKRIREKELRRRAGRRSKVKRRLGVVK